MTPTATPRKRGRPKGSKNGKRSLETIPRMVRFDRFTLADIDALAARQGWTQSETVRQLVNEALIARKLHY